MTDETLHVFVPAHLAAVCADCNGFFLIPAGRCPGCGSQQFAPATPVEPRAPEQEAALVAAPPREPER